MKQIALGILLSLSCVPAMAQNYFLGKSKDGVTEYYILKATVDSRAGVTEVFSRIKPADGKLQEFRTQETEARKKANESTEGFEKLGYVRRKIQYNCKGRKFRVVEIVYYDLSGGEIDKTERDDKVKWEPVPAGSMRELEFKKVCNL
jgi:hypothetical protein